jgi:hypothetical protein
MRTLGWQIDASTLHGSLGNRGNAAGSGKANVWCVVPHKNSAALRVGPSVLQILTERPTDVLRQWHESLGASLGVKRELACLPIDVIELEHAHLDGTQTKPGEGSDLLHRRYVSAVENRSASISDLGAAKTCGGNQQDPRWPTAARLCSTASTASTLHTQHKLNKQRSDLIRRAL